VRHRFVAICQGAESRLEYTPLGGDTLDLRSTFVPQQLRGRGIGGRIVRRVLEYARDQNLRVIPSCWFVRDFIAANPRYRPLLADPDNPNGDRLQS
jgi:predicted GNAT family acetyltransferase